MKSSDTNPTPYYKRVQANQGKALEFCKQIAANEFPNGGQSGLCELVKGGAKAGENLFVYFKEKSAGKDLTETLEILNDMKDARSNIFCYRSDGHEDGTITQVRDARGAKKPPIIAPEAFAIQIINHARAAIDVAKDNLSEEEFKTIEAKIIELALHEAQGILLLSEGKTDEDLSVEKQGDKKSWSAKLEGYVSEFNTVLANKLIDKGVKEAQKQLQDAKDYVNFQDVHYHKATIYNVYDAQGDLNTQIELNVMNLGLTAEQKAMFGAINSSKEGEKIQSPVAGFPEVKMDWFNDLKDWQQKQLKRAAPSILMENKICPTQLNFLPLAKNFYSKYTYLQKHGKTDPKLIMETLHGGTPTAMADDSKHGDYLSTEVIRNIKEFTKDGSLHINSLTTPLKVGVIEGNEPSRIKAAIINLEDKVDGINKITHAITPLNAGRMLGGMKNTDQYEEFLKNIGAVLKENDNELKPIKDYLQGSGLKGYKAAKSAAKGNPQLQRLINTKELLSPGLHRINLRDGDNINAQIASNMEIIASQVNDASSAMYELTNGQVKLPTILMHCKSGKDRTGVIETLTTFEASNEALGITENIKIRDENLQSQIAAGHTEDLAGGGQGGTHGAFGVQMGSAKDAPNLFLGKKYSKWLGRNTAKMNKFKVNKEDLHSLPTENQLQSKSRVSPEAEVKNHATQDQKTLSTDSFVDLEDSNHPKAMKKSQQIMPLDKEVFDKIDTMKKAIPEFKKLGNTLDSTPDDNNKKFEFDLSKSGNGGPDYKISYELGGGNKIINLIVGAKVNCKMLLPKQNGTGYEIVEIANGKVIEKIISKGAGVEVDIKTQAENKGAVFTDASTKDPFTPRAVPSNFPSGNGGRKI
jgi:hypothetical protein